MPDTVTGDPRLAALDRAAARPLVEIVAAHGWGKSSLVRTWADERAITVLTLEDADRVPARLGARMVAALSAARGSVTDPDLGRAASDDAPVEAIVERIVAAAEDPPFRLVLDEADVLAGSPSLGLVRAVIALPGARVRLVVCSREELGLVDANAAARGDAHRWGAAELRLDLAAHDHELASVVDPSQRASLARRVRADTDGWPAGLGIVRDAVADGGGPWQAALDDPSMDDAVLQTLLGEEPAEVRHLVAIVAMLDGVGAHELARLRGSSLHQVRSQLDALVRRGVLSGSGGATAAREARLAPVVRRAALRALARGELAPRAVDEVVAAHRDGEDDPVRLLGALTSVAAVEPLRALLRDHGGLLVAVDAPGVLDAVRVIDRSVDARGASPVEVVDEELRLLHADALVAEGAFTAALAVLDDMSAGSSPTDATTVAVTHARAVRRVRVLTELGRWDRVIEEVEAASGLAADPVSDEHATTAAELRAYAARAHLARGATERAVDAIGAARVLLDTVRDIRVQAIVRREAARLALATDPDAAPAALRDAHGFAEATDPRHHLVRLRVLQAEHHLRQGRTTEALFELDRAESALGPASAPERRELLVVRAEVLLRTGRLDAALAAVHDLDEGLDVAADRADGHPPPGPGADGAAAARISLVAAEVARERGEVEVALEAYARAADQLGTTGDRTLGEAVAVGRARIEPDRQRARDELVDRFGEAPSSSSARLAIAWLSLALGDEDAVRAALGSPVAADVPVDRHVVAEFQTLRALVETDRIRALDAVARRWHRLHDPVWAARVELGRARRSGDADARSRIVDLEARLAALGVHLDAGDVGHEVTVGASLPPRLAVRVLGGLRVRSDGQHRPLDGRWMGGAGDEDEEDSEVLAAALALLAVQAPRSVPREAFAVLLDDRDDEPGLDALLGAIRAVLTTDDGALCGVSGSRTALALRLGAVAHDLTLLRQRIDAAEQAFARGGRRAAAVLLEAAKHVDRGPLLDGRPLPVEAVSAERELARLRSRAERLERALGATLGSIETSASRETHGE